MSDFYQILKREVEPSLGGNTPQTGADDFEIEKRPVENSKDKEALLIKKRVKTKTQTIKYAKKRLPKNKITKRERIESSFLMLEPANPIWLTMAETAKLGGVQKKTIKRALRAGYLKYRIIESRYQVDLRSALLYFYSKKKLWNKLKEDGIGQYVKKWRE
jgi:hypothetical protein